MSILILAEDHDPTVDRVVAALRERGVEPFRADTAWFPQRLSVAAELDGEAWSGVLRGPARRISLRDVCSVWYRSPTGFRMDPRMSEAERWHAECEARLGLGGLLLSAHTALWVNHPGREADADYKPRQLVTARRCKLHTPQTLITNEPDAVRAFAARNGRIISKVLGSNVLYEQGRRKVAHTHLLDDDLADLDGIDLTCHLLQRYIHKRFDARCIVIGSRVFTVAIHAHSPEAKVDFRSDYSSLTYEVVDPPHHVLDGIRAYMDAFGLAYACVDFAVGPGPEGPETFWFLEANCRGQHGWLERQTSLPLSAAIAELLIEGDRP
jgi:ATP-grasp ribosomal peptide maturase